jgi:hypothetical protein
MSESFCKKKKNTISDSTKIRLMGDEFFYEDGRKDGHHKADSRVSRSSAMACKIKRRKLLFIDMDMSYTRVLHIKVAYLTNDVTPFTSHGRCYARA